MLASALVPIPGKAVSKTVATFARALPEAQAGASGVGGSPHLSAKWGGQNLGDADSNATDAFEAVAEGLQLGSDLTGKVAEYERRTNEWTYELAEAGLELKEVEKKLAVAQLQIQKAEHELAVHKQEIEHNQQVAEFYRSKFTNQELYSWMISRLSSLYFQAYNLAYSMARSAEKALQFELPTTETFISFGHWDNLRKGLLAGESLLLDLHRMDKFNLDQDRRWLAIDKRISLKHSQIPLLAEALDPLKREGACTFELSEALFNSDYHGHYCRQIKTIAISVHIAGNGITNPYDGIHATLTQVSHKLLLEPNIEAVRYLMKTEGAIAPDNSILRENWRAYQQVAISHAETKAYDAKETEADLGMFNLDFMFDNAYFPFENTGAVSQWQLELPQETNSSIIFNQIEHIVIHLRYTARSENGSSSNWSES